jgi:glycosyltransferase involved in cell wall biosynthesis
MTTDRQTETKPAPDDSILSRDEIDLQLLAVEQRPLVTFAVFAYNQEKYVREAVKGAFSQTYQPLEIVLSDDCSTDRTFEIMEQMAAAYQGPHTVRVRRNEVNLGTAAHFSIVAVGSTADLFIVAAGDDISKPERTERLVLKWLQSNKASGIFHSNMLRFFDGHGPDTAIPTRPRKILTKDQAKAAIREGGSFFLFAPSFMYTRDFLIAFPPLLGGSIVEDGPMIYRCAMVADFTYVDEYLVYVRESADNAGVGLSIGKPKHWNTLFRSRMLTAFNVISDVDHLRNQGIEIDERISPAMTRRIRDLSNFIVPETGSINMLQRIRIALNMLVGRAYPRNIRSSLVLSIEILLGGASLRQRIGRS